MHIEYINEYELASNHMGVSIDPENRYPLVYMVVPEPPKPPYLAFHNGENWVMMLGLPINERGEIIDNEGNAVGEVHIQPC